MSGFLLDTNCISELVRSKPEPRVLQWIDSADENLLYLSVLTLGEIRKGVASLSPSQRRTRLETWLELELQARFAGRILGIDSKIADRWGILAAGATTFLCYVLWASILLAGTVFLTGRLKARQQAELTAGPICAARVLVEP